jgi:hypothetical protein
MVDLKAPRGWICEAGKNRAEAYRKVSREFISLNANGTFHMGQISFGEFAIIRHDISDDELRALLPIMCAALGLKPENLKRMHIRDMGLSVSPEDAEYFAKDWERFHDTEKLFAPTGRASAKADVKRKVRSPVKPKKKGRAGQKNSKGISSEAASYLESRSESSKQIGGDFLPMEDRALAAKLFPIDTGLKLDVAHSAGPWFGIELYPNSEDLIRKDWHQEKLAFLVFFNARTGIVGAGRFGCAGSLIEEYIHDMSIHPEFVERGAWGHELSPEFELRKVTWDGHGFRGLSCHEDDPADYDEGMRVREVLNPQAIFKIGDAVVRGLKSALAKGEGPLQLELPRNAP